MKKYWEIMKSQIKINAAYSAWYWSNIISNVLKVFVLYYFWSAIYANGQEVGNIPLGTMLTYAIIASLLNGYMGGVGADVGKLVRDGDIGLELIRPYDIFYKFLAMEYGFKLSMFVRDTIPVLLISFLIIGIELPATGATFIFFLISTVLGILIGSQFDLIIGILAFWLKYIWGLTVLKNGIVSFFSGALLPISLFPEWLFTISQFLPFKYMVYVPVAIYTGQISGPVIYFYLLYQVICLLILFFGIRIMWRLALKNVVIYGG